MICHSNLANGKACGEPAVAEWRMKKLGGGDIETFGACARHDRMIAQIVHNSFTVQVRCEPTRKEITP